MKIESHIYYFSGTGNSLFTAKELADKLGQAKVFNIATVTNSNIISATRIIFIYPVYGYGMPLMMRDFIKKHKIECSYCAALCTYGTSPGGALKEIKKILKKKKIKLNYAQGIPCVENFIPIFGAPKTSKKEKRLNLQNQAIEIAAENINNQEIIKIGGFHPASMLIALLYRVTRPILKRLYRVNKSCTGCQICYKVCPAKAISMKNGRPKFKNNCQLCQSCLNFCPSNAINFLRLRSGTPRYHHPDINVRQMINSEENIEEKAD